MSGFDELMSPVIHEACAGRQRHEGRALLWLSLGLQRHKVYLQRHKISWNHAIAWLERTLKIILFQPPAMGFSPPKTSGEFLCLP